MNMKRILCLLMSLLLILSCFSCGKKETKTEEVSAPSAAEEAQTEVTAAGTPQEETAVTAPVTEYTPYGAVEMSIPFEDFNASGFDLGDSCEVRFSNGYTLEDVPYYNGYNARSGDPVICAYPGYKKPVIAFCQGTELWKDAGLKEGDSVTVTLKEKGRYRETQDILNIVYSNERSEYESDEDFANFRALSGGDLKEGMFYRGASPVDNSMSRAEITDNLLWAYGIRYRFFFRLFCQSLRGQQSLPVGADCILQDREVHEVTCGRTARYGDHGRTGLYSLPRGQGPDRLCLCSA